MKVLMNARANFKHIKLIRCDIIPGVVFPPIIHEYHSPLSTVIICTHIITQTISTIAILDSCHT
jgi:hypothetical protein